MAGSRVNQPSGPPPSVPARTRRKPPPPPPRRNWLPAVFVVVLGAVVIAAVAGFVLMRSSDSDVPDSAFADACSIVDRAAIQKAVGYGVSAGVTVPTPAPLSGCTFAPTDPAKPPVGVIVTNDAPNAESFDRSVLSASYESIESVRGIGDKATFVSKEGAAGPDSIDALLVVTKGNKGVEISVGGTISSNEAFDIARSVAELYVSELGLG